MTNCEELGCDLCHDTVKVEWSERCGPVPEAYKKYFPYPALNPIQQEAFRICDKNPKASFAACSGTGTGKTVIAERAIIDEFKAGGKTVYIGPLKALVDEKMDEWTERFPDMKIIAVTSDTKADELGGKSGAELDKVLQGYDLILASFEMFSSWSVKMKTYSFMNDVTCLVVDEVHNLADKTRGGGLEGGITRFLVRRNGGVRVVFLSATFDNAHDLKKWVEEFVEEFHVINFPFSPIIRHMDVVEYMGRTDRATAELTLQVINGLHRHKNGVIGLVYSKPAVMQTVGDVNAQFAGGAAMAHTAAVPRKDRKIAEKKFKNGELPCIVASPTIAMGVNLPCLNIVLVSDYWDADNKERRLIEPYAYRQIIGRAGRPPHFKEAYVTSIVRSDLREGFDEMLDAPDVITGTILETLDAVLCAEVTVNVAITLPEIFEWYSKLFSSITSNLTEDEVKAVFKETITWLIDHKFIYADKNGALRAEKKGVACARMMYRPKQLEYVLAVLNTNDMFNHTFNEWTEENYIELVREIYDSKYSDVRVVKLQDDVMDMFNYTWMIDKRSGRVNWRKPVPNYPFVKQIKDDMGRLTAVLGIVGLRAEYPQMIALKNLEKSFAKGAIPTRFVEMANILERKGLRGFGAKRLLMLYLNGVDNSAIFDRNFPERLTAPDFASFHGIISESTVSISGSGDPNPILPARMYQELRERV